MHGVIIDFVDGRRRKRSAVYLPDVIPEQGWTKSETIESLIKKVFENKSDTQLSLHRGARSAGHLDPSNCFFTRASLACLPHPPSRATRLFLLTLHLPLLHSLACLPHPPSRATRLFLLTLHLPLLQSGCNERVTDRLLRGIKLSRFQSSKYAATRSIDDWLNRDPPPRRLHKPNPSELTQASPRSPDQPKKKDTGPTFRTPEHLSRL